MRILTKKFLLLGVSVLLATAAMVAWGNHHQRGEANARYAKEIFAANESASSFTRQLQSILLNHERGGHVPASDLSELRASVRVQESVLQSLRGIEPRTGSLRVAHRYLIASEEARIGAAKLVFDKENSGQWGRARLLFNTADDNAQRWVVAMADAGAHTDYMRMAKSIA